MRLMLAALFVVVSLSFVSAQLDKVIPVDKAPRQFAFCMGIVLIGLCTAAIVLFNRWGSDPLGLRSSEEQVRHLEAQGLLETCDFRATRAFEVEEFEDEGLHYFLELENGDVLYLNGQYLYDYEPLDDDPKPNQARCFPCTEFTVRRHREEGYGIDILCRGHVLKPEVVAPPFQETDYDPWSLPEDGDIIHDRTYDDIKSERLRLDQQA